MANNSLLYIIHNDIVKAVTGIGKKTYLGRPKLTDGELTNFVVVEPFTSLLGNIAGDEDVAVSCYGTLSVYCKAKSDGTLNINSQTDLTQKIMDLFPINTSHISATKPRILMRGDDGNGYQITQVTYKLRTKYNARQIN